MRISIPLVLLACLVPPASAQVPVPAGIAAVPEDVRYPGILTLQVDATDTERGIVKVRETIPVARPGTLTLRYPQWLPGNHSPSGPIEAVAGFQFTANGQRLQWRRNPLDMFAFDVEVPAGAIEVEVAFDYLTNQQGSISRTEMTPDLVNLQWEKVSLYPAGHYVRQIMIRPSVTLPAGFTGVAALDGETVTGNRIDYAVTDYETLVDSPMLAGRHYRRWELGHDVDLNVFADEAKDLEATAEQIAAHRRIVDQTFKAFGSKPFDRYEFLLGLSDELSGIGLEHHRSSENIVGRGYFTDWTGTVANRTLLPHEITHSWNGKYRRPIGTWSPDYNRPIVNELLWVYEGQTSFWDGVIAARSGIVPKEAVLGEMASNAAFYSAQAGRKWRPLIDTTNQPIIAYRRPLLYSSYQRGTDYYSESALVWIDADTLIRQRTNNRRSLDDFARAFFAVPPGSDRVETYTFEDVVTALNRVTPYDWATFLRERVYQPAQAPLGGIERGGYRLVWKDEPNPYDASVMKLAKFLNLSYSLGFSVGSGGRISGVIWDGPGHAHGLAPGDVIVAVDGREYSEGILKDAIQSAKGGSAPIKLLIKDGDRYRDVAIPWNQGLRYPHLEKAGSGKTLLDRMLEPLR